MRNKFRTRLRIVEAVQFTGRNSAEIHALVEGVNARILGAKGCPKCRNKATKCFAFNGYGDVVHTDAWIVKMPTGQYHSMTDENFKSLFELAKG